MALYCPFCHAKEDARLSARDEEEGEDVLLVMFNCPFHFRFYSDQLGSEEEMQSLLELWRKEEGNAWLDNVGPVMKQRELQNIQRYLSTIQDS